MAIPNFGSPANFGDWTTYAGFDSTKPMMGIVPPLGKSQFEKQPIPPTFAQVGQRMQDVGTQLSQGNFANALKTFASGAVPPVTPVTSTAPIQNNQPKDLNGDGMISDFEE